MPQTVYQNFAGGVNKQIGPVVTDPVSYGGQQFEAMFFAEDSDFFDASESGLIKSDGYESQLASALSGGGDIISGIFEFKSGATRKKVVGASVSQTLNLITGTSASELFNPVPGFLQSEMYTDVNGNDILLVCGPAISPLEYDGATCTETTFIDPEDLLTSPFRPTGVGVFRDRLFYWGDEAAPHKIFTPRPGTHNNFDNSDNTVDVFEPALDGGIVTGFKALTADIAVIYKEDRILRLGGSAPFNSGPDQFVIGEITREVGCIAPRTICTIGPEHYFLAQNGLRQLKPLDKYGDLEHLQPTYPIQPTIQEEWNFSDYAAMKEACAVYDPLSNHILLSIPTGSSSINNRVYHYDIITKGIDPRVDLEASAFGLLGGAVYHGGYDGQFYKTESGQSADGADIMAFWRSKYIAHGGLCYKRYRRLRIYADGNGETSLIIMWRLLRDGEVLTEQDTGEIAAGGGDWDVAQWDVADWSSATNNFFEIKNLGRGHAIQLEFRNVSDTQSPRIRQVHIDYDMFSMARG